MMDVLRGIPYMIFSRKVFLVDRLRVPNARAQTGNGNHKKHYLAIAALIFFSILFSTKGMAEVGSCYYDNSGTLYRNDCLPGFYCPTSVVADPNSTQGCIGGDNPTPNPNPNPNPNPTPNPNSTPTPNPGGGGACVPARRERSCPLPANAVSSTSYSFYDCNARRWSNYSACETICNAGFNLVGNSCVPIPKPTCSLEVLSGLEGLTLPQKGGELKVRVSNLQGATIVGQPTPRGAIRNNNEFTWTIPENTGTIGINHKFEVTVSKNGVTGTCSRTLSQTPKCVFSNYNVRNNFPASGGTWPLDMSTNVGEVRIESSAFGNSFDAYATLQSNQPLKKVFNFRLGATNRTENFPFTFVAFANNGGECGRWPANQVPAPPSCTLNIISGLEGSVIPQAGGQLRFRVSNVSSGAEITRIPNGATSSGNDFTLNISQNPAATAINHNFEVVVSRNGVNGTCKQTPSQAPACSFINLPTSIPSGGFSSALIKVSTSATGLTASAGSITGGLVGRGGCNALERCFNYSVGQNTGSPRTITLTAKSGNSVCGQALVRQDRFLGKPTITRAVANADDSVSLEFTRVASATHYKIFRKTGNGSFVHWQWATDPTVSYRWGAENFTEAKTYFFKVSAFRQTADEGSSEGEQSDPRQVDVSGSCTATVAPGEIHSAGGTVTVRIRKSPSTTFGQNITVDSQDSNVGSFPITVAPNTTSAQKNLTFTTSVKKGAEQIACNQVSVVQKGPNKLTVTRNMNGIVEANDQNVKKIDCGFGADKNKCSATVVDRIISLTAKPNSGYQVSGWTGCTPSNPLSNNTCVVTMDGEKTVSVSYAKPGTPSDSSPSTSTCPLATEPTCPASSGTGSAGCLGVTEGQEVVAVFQVELPNDSSKRILEAIRGGDLLTEDELWRLGNTIAGLSYSGDLIEIRGPGQQRYYKSIGVDNMVLQFRKEVGGLWRPLQFAPSNWRSNLNFNQKHQLLFNMAISGNNLLAAEGALNTVEFLAKAFPGVYGVDMAIHADNYTDAFLGATIAVADVATFGAAKGLTVIKGGTSLASPLVCTVANLGVGAAARGAYFARHPTFENGVDAGLSFMPVVGYVGLRFVKLVINDGRGFVVRPKPGGPPNSFAGAQDLAEQLGMTVDDIAEGGAGMAIDDLARIGVRLQRSIIRPDAALPRFITAIADMLNAGPNRWICVPTPRTQGGGRIFTRGLGGIDNNGAVEGIRLFSGEASKVKFVNWGEAGHLAQYSYPLSIKGRTCDIVEDLGDMARVNFQSTDIDQIATIVAQRDLVNWTTYYKSFVEHYRNLGFDFAPGSRGAAFFRDVMEARTSFLRPDGSFDEYGLEEALQVIVKRYQ